MERGTSLMSYRTIEFANFARKASCAALMLAWATGTASAQTAPAPAPAPAPASAPAPATGDVSQWLKVCNPKQPEICAISKDYVAESGPNALARFAIQTTPDAKKFAIGITVPLGFVFPPGIPISVDGDKKITAQYVICLPESPQAKSSVVCVAQAPVADDFVGALKKGQKLQLQLTSGNSKQINLEFSLAGFSKSFDGPDMGEASVAKQREEAAKIFQQKAQQRGQELIDAQRKQKAGGG